METKTVCSFLVLSSFLLNAFANGGDWNILNQKAKNKLGISLKNYCESWRMNVELNNIKEFDVVPEECTAYIGKYMTSTQYKVDLERAFDECTLFLSSNFVLKGDGKDAWIFDIDDTLLSTVPYFKQHQYGGEKLNKSCFEAWMKGKKAPAVAHALDFYNLIKGRGLKIFLISSRGELLRDATTDNLLNAGYYGWTGLVLRFVRNSAWLHFHFYFNIETPRFVFDDRGFEDTGKSAQSFKADQRKKLKDAGYRLWGIVGDHWSSLDGLPTAKRTFKLPNSLYYVA